MTVPNYGDRKLLYTLTEKSSSEAHGRRHKSQLCPRHVCNTDYVLNLLIAQFSHTLNKAHDAFEMKLLNDNLRVSQSTNDHSVSWSPHKIYVKMVSAQR